MRSSPRDLALPQQGVLYHGLEVMGGGAILTGLVLGAIGVFVIERDFVKAAAFALAGAVLTFFGFMHGEAVGIGGGFGVTPGVALAYAVMAAGLFALAKTAPAWTTARNRVPVASTGGVIGLPLMLRSAFSALRASSMLFGLRRGALLIRGPRFQQWLLALRRAFPDAAPHRRAQSPGHAAFVTL